MAYLHLDVDHCVNISPEDLIGTSIAVLGITGSGKSNSSAVLVEESITAGFPMTIVDIEGEYWGLKEKFEILAVGRSRNADVDVPVEQAAKLAHLSFTERVPVILDMSEHSQEEMFDFLLEYFTGLWAASANVRHPYMIVLEEAHEFIPQVGQTPLKGILTRIASRGRKRGLSTVLISQRSSRVDKDLLTQTKLMFLHQVIHPLDKKVYYDLVPRKPREVEGMISGLQRGQAIVLWQHNPTVAQIRLRHTFHAGVTPSFESVTQPELQKIDAALLEKLTSTLPEQPETVESLRIEVERLNDTIKALRGQLVQAHEETARFRAELESKPAVIGAPPAEPQQTKLFNDDPFVSSGAMKLRRGKQEKQFEYLLKDILEMRKFQRTVLRYIVEREGRWFSRNDLAKSLDLSLDSVSRMTDLEQLGLIRNEGKGSRSRYTSTATEMFQREYPELDPEQLRETMLNKLMSKELRR